MIYKNKPLLILLLLSFSTLSYALDETDKADEQDPEAICITQAKRLILEQDQTINHGITFNNCLKAASGNNPLVWYFTGFMKLKGLGATPNYEEGLKWLTKAAHANITIAQKELADYYLSGGGIDAKIDVPKALPWLKQLARSSQNKVADESSFKLCALNLYGTGIPVNYDQALYWCKESGLKFHNKDGLTNLAYMYINGYGTPKDLNIGIDYYKTAANKGSALAQISLGRAYTTGKDLEPDYKEAFYWMNKAAEQQNSLALFYLAQMYEYGYGVDQDPQKAFLLYQKAANLGESQAQYMLGHWYEYSQDPKLDLAAKWYHKAAKQNNPHAVFAIAKLYRNQNPKEMILWLQRAASLGLLDANRELIKIYLEGTKETSPKPQLAFEQAQILAKAQDPNGIILLAQMYREGLGVDADLEKAQELLSDLNTSDAQIEKAYIKIAKQDQNGAIQLLKDANELGCSHKSCITLAKLYADQKNWEEAYFWSLVSNHLETEPIDQLLENIFSHLKPDQEKAIKEKATSYLQERL